MLIDTHCHLEKEEYDNLDNIIKNMDGYMIASGYNDSTNLEVIELVNKYDNVYGVIGLHPEEVDSVTDNRKYGNYRESEAPANVNGYGNLQNTGFSESWKINNIYDMAGNAYEYTNEILSNCCITRGGAYSNAMPYSCLSLRNRYIYGLTNSSFNMGFRIRLYIK